MELLHANGELGKHAPSYYAASSDHAPYPALESTLSADVCVIGAGYTGLSTALHLSEAGYSVVVLDAHKVGWGASGRNGGQLGTGFNNSQQQLEKSMGADAAKQLWAFSEQAKYTFHTLCETHNIDAEYKAGIIVAAHKARELNNLKNHCDHLRITYNYDQTEVLEKHALLERLSSRVYCGGIIDRGAGHIHPLKFAQGLARAAHSQGVKIFEHSKVSKVEFLPSEPHLVLAENGCVKAHNVVFACNGYIDELSTGFKKVVMPINNYMVATEPLGTVAAELLPSNNAVYDTRFVVNYYRLSKDNRLLFGGGESYGYKFPKDIAAKVRKPMERIFPELKGVGIDYAWGGTLGITFTRLLHAGHNGHGGYTAGGYSGHGVALSIETGKAIAEAIDSSPERFKLLCSLPCGRFPGGRIARTALLTVAMSGMALLDRI